MQYFDASALVKRYVREAGTIKIRRLLASPGGSATSRLAVVEITSAIMRRSREGAFPDAERDRALAALEKDTSALLVVELSPEVVRVAQGLLQRWPLRSGDAIQLASCLYLQAAIGVPLTFVAFDARLLDVARREGLHVA